MSTMLPRENPLSTGYIPGLASRARWAARTAAITVALLSTACTFSAVAHADAGGASPPVYTADVNAEAQGDAAEADAYADTDPSALTDFREPLSPYGSWQEDASYGTVWVPNSATVGADFAPYQSAGHWALDENDDWMWVSDYDWGYIPFHYGRWVWLAGSGWGWIPGRTYAPAWVNWRIGDGGYIGWAPMPPSWYWYGGVATGLWVTPYAAYCFVPTGYAFHEHVSTYVVRDPAVVRSAAATTRPYKPARPTVAGGPGHSAGSPHGGFRTASPRLNEAGVSSTGAPKARVAPDTRARALASRSSTASFRHSAFGAPLPSSHRGVASGPWRTHSPSAELDRGSRTLDRGQPGFDQGARAPLVDHRQSPAFDRSAGPVFRTPASDLPSTPRAAPSFAPSARPSFGGGPDFRSPAPSAPAFHPSGPSAPAFRPSGPSVPAFRPSPPAFRSSAPSAPAFRPSAPSAPAFHPSAPAFRPSAPTFHAPSAPSHGGGGGRHR